MSLRWVQAFGAILLLLSVVLTLRPRLLLAVVVAALAAAWWPLNNRVLEGATLIAVTPRHGLTVNDLLGVLGFVCAVVGVIRAAGSHVARQACLVGIFALAVGGVTAALLTGG